MSDHIETEVRFLEINETELKKRLAELNATDLGEDLLREIIFYDASGSWQKDQNKMVRLRATRDSTYLSYKHSFADHAQGTTEIELIVNDFEKARAFLQAVGLTEYRQQEKRRHSFRLGEVSIDIDEWPKIPAYVELEGENEPALKEAAKQLSLEWSTANSSNAAWVIENVYHIPVRQLKFFTFSKVE